ncbi:MAG TPA: hypothetical protein VEB22_10150 [Phycisphaerales bacterium]|nr:hypothetical protein [Phycisphaerales bacterium]
MSPTLSMYLWLAGMVLAFLGGLLLARGWWLDKAAGNARRPRCRRCWYELQGAAPREDGSVTCPECGCVARSTKELHRVRRSWGAVAAAAVLLAGGLYLSGRPVLSGGRWLYMLPRAVSARLWESVGAESYGRTVRHRVATGTAIDAEIESVARGGKGLVLRTVKAPNATPWNDVSAALKALAASAPDPEVDAAAAQLMLANNMLAREAAAYFQARGMPMAERVALIEAAMPAVKGTNPPTEYFEMLEKSAGDPAAAAALVRAASSGDQWSQWARHSVMQAGEPTLKATEAAFRASTDAAQRKRIAELFVESYPYSRPKGYGGFAVEMAKEKECRDLALRLFEFHSDTVVLPDATAKEWVLGNDAKLRAFALRIIGCQHGSLPEGCGEAVLRMHDAGVAMPCGVLGMFSGADRTLWLPRVKEGPVGQRRQACQMVAAMRPRFDEGVEVLRAVEADKGESEEMRVEARDALRRMGAWKGE